MSYPHFTDEEGEAQTPDVAGLRSRAEGKGARLQPAIASAMAFSPQEVKAPKAETARQ